MKTLSQNQILYFLIVLFITIFILRAIQVSHNLIVMNQQGVFDLIFSNR